MSRAQGTPRATFWSPGSATQAGSVEGHWVVRDLCPHPLPSQVQDATGGTPGGGSLDPPLESMRPAPLCLQCSHPTPPPSPLALILETQLIPGRTSVPLSPPNPGAGPTPKAPECVCLRKQSLEELSAQRLFGREVGQVWSLRKQSAHVACIPCIPCSSSGPALYKDLGTRQKCSLKTPLWKVRSGRGTDTPTPTVTAPEKGLQTCPGLGASDLSRSPDPLPPAGMRPRTLRRPHQNQRPHGRPLLP